MKKLIPIFFVLALFQLSQAQVRDKAVDKPPVKTKRNKNKTGNIGVSIDLTSIFRSLKKNKNCNKLRIIFPVNGSKFKSKITSPPLLRWKSSKPKLVNSYTVQLVRVNKRKKTILYQAKTDKTQMPWPKQVPWKTLNKGKTTYQWYVMAVVKPEKKCKNIVEQTKFIVTSEGQLYAVDKTDDPKISVSVIKRTGRNPQTGKEITTKKDKESDKEYQKRKLLNLEPKNNSTFKKVSDIEAFTWELMGDKIDNPHYVIEVVKLDKTNKPQRTFIAKIATTHIKPNALFRDAQLSSGQYRWEVTETTTGITSTPSFYTLSNCDINLAISNENIECLGYVGADIKYKICFDSSYSSTSGDLTFANSGSGLLVYDQDGFNLPYNLTIPNPTLITQIGSAPSTVSYCFEITVPYLNGNNNPVTAIDFGLQGDDLDPSSYICQPSAHLIFDNLPSCICNECDNIQFLLDDFAVTPNGNTGNQFNFSGNINVNVPIYGLEFQIQSYSYTANPGACTEGVSSVEESGMILMPGTTINGSTSLQLFNETASGSSNSNNNATKDIKYTSNSPLTGPIPVNLTIGLPGPLSGLSPSCCPIEYNVCIKVRIFYEDGTCKTCEFKRCFTFNNQ